MAETPAAVAILLLLRAMIIPADSGRQISSHSGHRLKVFLFSRAIRVLDRGLFMTDSDAIGIGVGNDQSQYRCKDDGFYSSLKNTLSYLAGLSLSISSSSCRAYL